MPARIVPSERISAVFSSTLTAADADIDINGHVFNLVYLHWVLDVAQAHSAEVGWNRERYEAFGGLFVVYRHEIDYLRPTFAGDEILVRTWIQRWGAATSLRRTQIVRADDGAELARAATTWAFVHADSGRARRIPAELKEAFAERQQLH